MASQLTNNTGLFVPTTNVWDVENLQTGKDITPELKELLVRLYQNINGMCIALNLKDSGYYVQNEFITGQLFFPDAVMQDSQQFRQSFRVLVNCGALPNATTLIIPHSLQIENSFIFTRIYGTATNKVDREYLPLPYASLTLINNIELSVDSTNVYITTGIDYSAYTTTYVIVEYTKQ